MAKLNLDSTISRIFEAWESKQEGNGWRPHLGGSRIGISCERAIWYTFRWAAPVRFPGRILRLFDTGHREEPRLIDDLRSVDCTVYAEDPITGDQFRVSDIGGHFGGSLDGLALGIVEAPKTWHLCEFKTSNDRGFKALQKNGVRQEKPEHFAQMQTYMGLWNEHVEDIKKRLDSGIEHVQLSELLALKVGRLERAFYIARNKNTDELYSERLGFDKTAFESFRARARRVIETQDAPERISDNPGWYECGYCDFRKVCHPHSEGAHIPAAHCRTCVNSEPVLEGSGGRWRCNLHNIDIPNHEMKNGCEDHLFLPTLIPFEVAGVDDASQPGGPKWVAYSLPDGRRLINMTAAGKRDFDQYVAQQYFEVEGVDLDNLNDHIEKEQVAGTSYELEYRPLDSMTRSEKDG